MCCIQCARCLGGLLVPLMLLGILTNALLCFPSMTLLEFDQITDEVTYFGGIIGLGIIMFFPAYALLSMKEGKTKKCCGWEICGARYWMFNSMVYAVLGVVGASYGVGLAWTAIKKGPKCDIGDNRWDYPFHEWDYLTDRNLWTRCKRPVGIVSWNLSIFSIQLAIGSAQLAICVIQVVNGLLGTVFGQWKLEDFC
ncbi:transmembrane 4 L6 family member 4-like [Notamacropus eugenii]|uniref:transmembrane 4 L6 family member 4-like n=1 Tax=Notamacropus eugenii TaxID=9315 RepID=UPI003B683914